MLVLRHSATSSRPLFNYDLVFKGKFYDVWRKNQTKANKIKSIPLGNNYAPGEVPNCDSIKKKVTNAEGKIYAAPDNLSQRKPRRDRPEFKQQILAD